MIFFKNTTPGKAQLQEVVMAARNEGLAEYCIQPNSSQRGRTAQAGLGDHLPEHLPAC